MTLGPGKLEKNIIRSIVNRKIYKKPIEKFLKSKIDWGHGNLSRVRNDIRLALRTQQERRCIYCRRRVKIERRNVSEHIEHYLDKSNVNPYRKWAFCCVNLTLACHACNIVKSTKDLGTTLIAPLGVVRYGCGPNLYYWLHPYFDDYHENIEVGPGWTYKVKLGAPAPGKAQQLIDDLHLDDIKTIEAEAEKLRAELSRLNDVAMMCVKRGKLNAAKIVLQVQKELLEESTFG